MLKTTSAFVCLFILACFLFLLPKRRRLASLRLGNGKQPGRVYRPRVPGEGVGPYPGGPQHRKHLNPQKHGDRTGSTHIEEHFIDKYLLKLTGFSPGICRPCQWCKIFTKFEKKFDRPYNRWYFMRIKIGG
jgi:hypothetical protein